MRTIRLRFTTRRRGPGFLVIAVSWLVLANAHGQIPADKLLQSLRPSADVNPYSRILTPDPNGELEARCMVLRQKTGAQLAVLAVTSLNGGQIENFANKMFVPVG